MFQRKNDLSKDVYTSFYRPKPGVDGVWELPLVLETVAEASETTIPLPLPYRKLNAEVLEYLEDVAQQVPKGEEARIVVYLPMEEIQPGFEQKLNKVLDIYGDARLEKLKREEKRALGASLSALAWGFAFMLVCQIIGVLADFPEHPTLFGDNWAQTISGLLPLGGADTAKEMLRTLVRLSEEAQLAPGRVARSVSMSGKVTQIGGPKESAQFVRLVHDTLLWSGDVAFAHDMLPMTGLCVSHLRRMTHNFDDVRADLLDDVRLALQAQAEILRMTGADDSACRSDLGKLPPVQETMAKTETADNIIFFNISLKITTKVVKIALDKLTGMPLLSQCTEKGHEKRHAEINNGPMQYGHESPPLPGSRCYGREKHIHRSSPSHAYRGQRPCQFCHNGRT